MQLVRDNAAGVATALGRLKTYYGNWHNHAREVDDAYNLQWKTKIRNEFPEDVEPHIPSTAPSIVDTLVDQVIVANYTVEAIPIGNSSQAVKNAALLSRLGEGFLDRINDSLEVPLMRQMVFDSLLRGAHCAKVLFDETLVPVEPKVSEYSSREAFLDAHDQWASQATTTFPYIVRPIDPLVVFPAPGRVFPLPYVFEVQKRHVSGVSADYPNWPDPKGSRLKETGDLEGANDPFRYVEVVQVWTAPDPRTKSPGQYGVLADGMWAKEPGPNPYGFVPYVFSYGGLGRIDEAADPISLGRTALSKILSELRAEVIARTTADALWQMYAFPTLLIPENPLTYKQKTNGPAATVQSQGDPDRYKFLERPAPPAELYMHLQKVEQGIRNASGTEALSGNRPTGVDYGYLQAIMVGQGRLKLDVVVSQVQRSMGRLLGMMLRLQKDVVQKPVRVFGTPGKAESTRVVRPVDIDNYNVKIHLDAVDPAENDKRVALGLLPLKAGVLSRRSYLRDYRRVQDVEEEEAEILKDTVMAQLVANGALLPYAAQNVQLDQAQTTLEDRKKVALRDMNNRDLVRSEGEAGLPGAGTMPVMPQQMTMEPGSRGPLPNPTSGGAGGSLGA